MRLLIMISCAFFLDFLFGDPHWLYHPICLIGNAIRFVEKRTRKYCKKETMAGLFLVIIITALSFWIPFLLLYGVRKVSMIASFLLETFFCYQILAMKSLKVESNKVYAPLKDGNLLEARKYLSYIVGRDTKDLDEKKIIKATVETIAENTTDGVIAPLIYMAIGGAPLGFLYKAINTMDSMVGYKNEIYFYYGKCAAKLDDVANYIPARIAAVCMIVAAFITRLNGREAVRIFLRDRYNHKSPNSAQTESVCAGALSIQLAGPSNYFGKRVEKPYIGDPIREVEMEDIHRANHLMYVTSFVGVFFCLFILTLITVIN